MKVGGVHEFVFVPFDIYLEFNPFFLLFSLSISRKRAKLPRKISLSSGVKRTHSSEH